MIDTICLNSASTTESEIFVLDNSNSTRQNNSRLSDDVKKNLEIVIQPSAEAGIFKFTDLEQECRTADVHTPTIGTVWTREAMWPI